MLERLFGFFSRKKAAEAPVRPLDPAFHYLVEEDAELLGFLSDKHSQQLKLISSFLDDARQAKELLDGGSDLVNLHFFSAQSDTNRAIATNHMSLLCRVTFETISRMLGNKIARIDGTNELPLSVSFVLFPAAHRCRESSFVLRQLKDRIDQYLSDTMASAAPFDAIGEDPRLWDNPFDVGLKSLPTYTSFYGLCGLILESFELYKEGGRFEDVVSPSVFDNASSIIRLNEHMLEVNINGVWVPVADAVDEIKRRSRSFNRRIHEIEQSFFANVYPQFLLSLHYEYLVFSVLNLFPLESALKDAKVFMRWYSVLFPSPTEEMKGRLSHAESVAVEQKAKFAQVADGLSSRIREIPRLDKEKALALAGFFKDCVREQFGIANGLADFDSQLSAIDSDLGALARKVWGIEVRSNDFLVLAQFTPHPPILDIRPEGAKPYFKPALDEFLLHRSKGRVLEVSSELSEALAGLHKDFNLGVLQSAAARKPHGRIEAPVVEAPVNDIESRLASISEGKRF